MVTISDKRSDFYKFLIANLFLQLPDLYIRFFHSLTVNGMLLPFRLTVHHLMFSFLRRRLVEVDALVWAPAILAMYVTYCHFHILLQGYRHMWKVVDEGIEFFHKLHPSDPFLKPDVKEYILRCMLPLTFSISGNHISARYSFKFA